MTVTETFCPRSQWLATGQAKLKIPVWVAINVYVPPEAMGPTCIHNSGCHSWMYCMRASHFECQKQQVQAFLQE